MKLNVVAAGFAAGMLFAASAPALASDIEESVRAFAEETARAWASEPAVIEAVRRQNAAHAELTQAQIDALDQQWRAEIGAATQPTIEPVAQEPLSAWLAERRDEAMGLVTEIFVMDSRGLNVAMSDLTSDYFQGDEAKWTETFLAGPEAVHVGEIEVDESTQRFQTQASVTVVDPESGEPIGAITVGLDLDYIE